ncbi:thioesterase family protein [Pseudomonas sp. MYb185]|uniref:acyl-CoA thioesterase n=1 Tax=Pseudomonas sp. MYb185 TaxID=1848729 RepID=UPI000CFBC8AB|nr:hypothetical protein [Pseudomonas sp. MYb185]PRB80911.1 hypothetical protein CQ007_11260 [Pseudomonas sp. MYb185]
MTNTTNNDATLRYTLSPRYTDLDTWRHVNNSRLYQLHQEARIRAHIQRFGKDAWFSDEVRLRPLRTLTHYRQVSWYGSDIDAQISVTACDDDSFQLHSELYQNGVLVGTQECVMAAFEHGHRVLLPGAVHRGLSEVASGNPAVLPPADYREQLAHAHNFPVRQQLTPRYADLDADSQRSEAALARYMEQARSGAIRQLEFAGLGVLVAAVDISFAHFHAGWTPVELAAGISRIGNSSFLFTGCALHKDEVQAAASSVMVVIDPATSRPVHIPPALREQLEAWVV